MKSIYVFWMILIILSLACNFSASEPTPIPASVSPTSAPIEPAAAAAQPAGNSPTLLYISGTTHIESKPQTWPNVDAFLNFLQQVTALGMKWSVGADIGWLEGEPRADQHISILSKKLQSHISLHDMSLELKNVAPWNERSDTKSFC